MLESDKGGEDVYKALKGSHEGQRQKAGTGRENQKATFEYPFLDLIYSLTLPWEHFCLSFSPMSQPNATLYINNLNDKINRDELKLQLYALFTTHGKLIDIVASKGGKMRGQAFLVFADLAGATAAMRACTGMMFYDKPLVRPGSPIFGSSLFSPFSSGSVMQRPSPMPPSEEKTPTLSLRVQYTPTLYCPIKQMERDQGMATPQTTSALRNAKGRMILTRKWR